MAVSLTPFNQEVKGRDNNHSLSVSLVLQGKPLSDDLLLFLRLIQSTNAA
ncbi:hypothetical protein VIAG107301_18340 [Vibrio agarivorans]